MSWHGGVTGVDVELITGWSGAGDDSGHGEVGDAVDLDRPNLARSMNYLLGGGANFAADRAAVRQLLAMSPGAAAGVRASRAFVGRAVRAALGRGHDQFLDLGAGIPSVGGLHTLAGPAARCVYVDVDPVAVAHTRDLLGEAVGPGHVTVARADLRDAGAVLTDPEVTAGLDLRRPTAVVCNSVLQWLPDDGAALADVFAAYRDALAPGSLLVLGAPHPDLLGDDEVTARLPVIEQAVAPIRLRRRAEVTEIVEGWEVLEPGVVDVLDWPAPSGADPVGYYGVVGAKG